MADIENDLRKKVHLQEMVRRLYAQMPGAPMPPSDRDGFKMWGDVDGTEHWAFCEQIALEIVRAAQAYSR